jgi:hypothetical protein
MPVDPDAFIAAAAGANAVPSGAALIKGYLEVALNEAATKWKRRWFVLDEVGWSQYLKQSARQVQAEYNIYEARIEAKTFGGARNAVATFGLEVQLAASRSSGEHVGKTVRVCAPTKADAASWLAALRKTAAPDDDDDVGDAPLGAGAGAAEVVAAAGGTVPPLAAATMAPVTRPHKGAKASAASSLSGSGSGSDFGSGGGGRGGRSGGSGGRAVAPSHSSSVIIAAPPRVPPSPHSAAASLQRVARGRMLRRAVAQATAAALRVQAVARGRRARRALAEPIECVQLGLTLALPRGRPHAHATVTSLRPGGLAAACGSISPGDALLAVNGMPCPARAFSFAYCALHAPFYTLRLSFRRPLRYRMELGGGAGSPSLLLLRRLPPEPDAGAVVDRVQPPSAVAAAARPAAAALSAPGSSGAGAAAAAAAAEAEAAAVAECRVRAGDILLSINGVRVDCLHFEDTLAVLRSAQFPLELNFRVPPSSAPEVHQVTFRAAVPDDISAHMATQHSRWLSGGGAGGGAS